MERIKGIKIDDIEALDAAGIDRHQVALTAVGMIVKEMLVDGFFHADPLWTAQSLELWTSVWWAM